MPDFLHKYRDLSGDGLAWLRQSLITKSLWFSGPAAFNDPFDCAPIVETSWSKDGVAATSRRVADRRTRGMDRFGRRREKRRMEANAKFYKLVTQDDAQAAAEFAMADIRKNMGVLSLSADPTNVLMWSHYARSHTGALLTFRTDCGDIISEAQEVIYQSERPKVDFVGDRSNAMVNSLLHKADYWSYEQEWRTVRTGHPGFHAFDPRSLVAITFGAFTPEEHIRVIKQAAGIGGLRLGFAQTAFDAKRFALNFRDLTLKPVTR